MRNLIQYFFLICYLGSCVNKNDLPKDEHQDLVDYYQSKYQEHQRVDVLIAQTYIDSIYYVATQNDNKKGIGIAYLDKGLLENIKGNYQLALSFNKKSLKEFTHLKNDTLIAKALSAIGVNYWQLGANDKALSYLFQALKINDKYDLQNEIAENYNQISMVYQLKNEVKIAENFALKSLEIINKTTPVVSHISTYHNLANIYGMQGKYKEALQLDSIGLSYCNKLNNEFGEAMFYDNMANCYFFTNKFDTAIFYHQKAISIDSVFNNNKQLGDSYYNLGAIYEKLGNNTQAIECYTRSIKLCRNAGYMTGLKNVLETLGDLYFRNGNTNEGYQLLKQSIIVKDSIINESSEKKIAELQTLFETEKKKKQIIQQELKINRRNISLIILGTVFLISLFIYIILYNKNRLKQQKILQQELLKEEEKRTKAVLESEENERQRIARELHDGVGQLLSATKLNLSMLPTTDEDKLKLTLSILDDSIKEVRSISHNMVPDTLLKYGLVQAINVFTKQINQTQHIIFNFENNGFIENSLNNTEKLMLYRIIQEAINNTLKYANASTVSIQLSADEQEITVIIEDNGIGFDINEIQLKNGIGLRNMQIRTSYLKGKIEIDSTPKNGTTIIIEIPLT